MKKIVTISLMVFLSIACYSQTEATFGQVKNKEVKGKLDKYISQDQTEFCIGDTLYIGTSKDGGDFNNIMQNSGMGYYPLPNNASGNFVVITALISKSRTLQVKTTKAQGSRYDLIILDFEKALFSNEIKASKMTSDEALEELKRAKDKLDLGLITQQEFDSIKKELASFIK